MLDIEQETTKDNQTDMVNINSISFNSNQLVIVAKLKTFSSQNSTIIPCKTDTGGDGNIMLIHIFKILFPRVANAHMAEKQINNKSIVINIYKKTTIKQLGTFKNKNLAQ